MEPYARCRQHKPNSKVCAQQTKMRGWMEWYALSSFCFLPFDNLSPLLRLVIEIRERTGALAYLVLSDLIRQPLCLFVDPHRAQLLFRDLCDSLCVCFE